MPSYLIADGSELEPEWLEGAQTVGITAGASAPEVLVEDVIDALRRLGPVEVSTLPGRRGEHRIPAAHANWPTALSRQRQRPVRGVQHRKTEQNGNSVSQGNAHRRLHPQAEAHGAQALSAGADAGAAVPLQSRLRRLRQDRLSRRDPEPAPVGQGMPRRRRRVRRADGGHPRRRAADPQGDRRDRQGHRRAQEIRLALHQRAAAGEEAAPVRAVALSVLLGPSRRAAASTTTSRSARRACSTGRSSAIKAAKAKGFSVNVNCHAVRRPSRRGHRGRSSTTRKELGVGVSISPGYAYERAPDQEHFLNRRKTKELFRDMFAHRARARTGSSSSPACSWISSPATRPTTARPGACRRATSSAGRSPAICSAKATPRPSRN